MKAITVVIFVLFLFPSLLFGASPGEISGAVAYTDVIRFDYTKDGIRDRVQFWLEFKGKTAVGVAEEPGYVPEEGTIFYYLLDLDNNKKVTNWLMGFSMVSEPAPSGPYPMKNLVIDGNTARFEAFNRQWTVKDGGLGFEKDTVLVDDGFKPKPLKLYGGDVTVAGKHH